MSEDQVEDGSVEITLEEDHDSETQVEVEVAAEPEPAKKPEEDKHERDLEEQSEKVKKRIDKLTYKIREAERREQAALDFARGLKGELDTYKEKASVLDRTLVQEFDTRIKSQEKMAKDKLKHAIEMGDPDGQIEAQTLLATIAVDNERLRVSRIRQEQDAAFERQRAETPQYQAPTQEICPDPKAQTWAERNEWFGSDRAMTATAYAIHDDLITREGFDPTSDEYYEELDHRMRQDFPHKFKKPEAAERPQSPVASARPASKPSQRKISLTPSQVKIAKALNVSLEEYAKHARKQMLGQ
jgi:hypothetical protein